MRLGECVRRACALVLLCFKARGSCDSLTVTSHNSLGRRVARFVIIFIGAWGLIGKWGQSNEAARLSGYLLSISNQAPPLALSIHSFLSLSIFPCVSLSSLSLCFLFCSFLSSIAVKTLLSQNLIFCAKLYKLTLLFWHRLKNKNCKWKDRWQVSLWVSSSTHLWYILYLYRLHLCFSLSPPSNTAWRMALHAPIILSEDETSTFEHVKIKRFLADGNAHFQTHGREPIARTRQQPTCFSRLQQRLQQPCPPHTRHARSHINIIRHASLLLWWMTFGDSGSDHPPLGLISHCHKSIRERGKFDVFISLRLFGATGLTSSR